MFVRGISFAKLVVCLVKTPNDHFAWLFDKLFVAITYAISLCYLLFLVAIRRSKNGNIIHGKIIFNMRRATGNKN